MFVHPPVISRGPSSSKVASEAGLPYAEVPGDLRQKVQRVLEDEPEHPEPDVRWARQPASDVEERGFSLGGFLWEHRLRLAIAVVLVAVETIAHQLGPVLIQVGIDEGILAGDHGVLSAVVLAYSGLLLLATLLRVARMAFTGRTGQKLVQALRVRVFSHMQRLGMDFYTGERAGVLLTRMTSDIEVLSVLLQDGIINFAVQTFTLMVVTVLLFRYEPLLALITLITAAPATAAASFWYRRRSTADYLKVRDRIAELLGSLQESLAGVRAVIAHNRRDLSMAEHRRAVAAHRNAAVRASRANSLYAPGCEAIGIATQALLLTVGGHMAVSGRITVGELAAFLLFLTTFFAPVQTLVQLYSSYQQGNAAATKLRGLLDTEPAVRERADATELPPVRGEIVLAGVDFAYEPGRPVLRNVHLSVAAGETLALVGATGAGKTTIARLMTRMYDPTRGSVCIDGRDLRDVLIDSLRGQVGFVPQEPFLFAGTVRHNVGFARPEAVDAELHEALAAVGADAVVERLGGLDGVVHERGVTLSAGERQLLVLARVFVAQPRILVLDEATSSLDMFSETRIRRVMKVLLEGRTAVIIAHRLDTARRADRIVVMHRGRIVESGGHDELIAADGHYTAMYEVWSDRADETRKRGSGI